MTEQTKENLRSWLEQTASLIKGLELSTVEAPKLPPAQRAAWLTARMEELAATRQYLDFYLEQVNVAWVPLQRQLHAAQKEMVEVTVLPTKAPSAPRQKKPVNQIEVTLKEASLPLDKKREIARILGITL